MKLTPASILLVLGLAGSAVGQDHPAITILKADRIHVGDGTVIEDASVVIVDGRIKAIERGTAAIPNNAAIIAIDEATITPGLIDANARLGTSDLLPEAERPGSWLHRMFEDPTLPPPEPHACCSHLAECELEPWHDQLELDERCPRCGHDREHAHEGEENHEGHDHSSLVERDPALASGVRADSRMTEATSEVVPHTRVVDSLNLLSKDLERLLQGGVTTACVAPDSSAVIGPACAIIRTGGSLRDRVLEGEGPIQAAVNAGPYRSGLTNRDPSRFFGVTMRARRPTSRMGVTWVFRKAFSDAIALSAGQPIGGSDTAPEVALHEVQRLIDGERALRVHARTQPDIETALRLTAEFDVPFTLIEGTDAYRCTEGLRERDVSVVFGPIYLEPESRSALGENRENRFTTLRALLDAGIETALSAQDLRDEDGLARQAMYAVRSGVKPEQALEAVTRTPARLLGLEDELGTVEVGKRADLVVWSGEPFAATSRPLLVLVDGRIEVDNRDANPDE